MTNISEKLSKQEIAQIVESAQLELWKQFFEGCSPAFKQKMGMQSHVFGGASATMMESYPTLFYNRVLGLGVKQPASEAMLDDIIELFSQHKVLLRIPLSPYAQPGDLPAWLDARGFKQTGNLAKMIRGNEPPPRIETDLRVKRVDVSDAAQFGDIFSRAFGWPDWSVRMADTQMAEEMIRMGIVYGYIAYDGDVPAATGMLHVSGDVGGLYHAATLPGFRRRGAQSAIMARRIQDGIDLGCHWFSTEALEEKPESPNPSYHNMLRTGFELAYLRPIYELQTNPAA